MEIRGDSLHGVPLLAITGDVDHSTAPEFDRAIRQNLNPEDPRLLVDLSGCCYIDSGGLAVFLYLVREIRTEGWLGVIGADRNLKRLFQIVGLAQEPAFHMFADADGAAALVAEGPSGAATSS
jgi:anti-sigma B factor antagonist